ncbi:unnamed protein product [Cochlearia groenlandica]
MEKDLYRVVSVCYDSSLPCAGMVSNNASSRASFFRRFLSFFCCNATLLSSSESRCSIQIVDSESASSNSPSDGSTLTSQGGLIRAFSLSDELYLSTLGHDYIQGGESTPQGYVLVDESSFGGTDLEQDGRSEDSGSQSSVLTEELSFGKAISMQDRRSISSHAFKESDFIWSNDSNSRQKKHFKPCYETIEELTLGETTSEQDRRSIPNHAYEGSDSIQDEDSRTRGYERALEELALDETISEHERRNLPNFKEGYDSIPGEDLTAQLTEIESTRDRNRRRSIQSTFPPQRSPRSSECYES